MTMVATLVESTSMVVRSSRFGNWQYFGFAAGAGGLARMFVPEEPQTLFKRPGTCAGFWDNRAAM